MTHIKCNRCGTEQGPFVILDRNVHVCGGCITQIAKGADITALVGADFTPAAECMEA